MTLRKHNLGQIGTVSTHLYGHLNQCGGEGDCHVDRTPPPCHTNHEMPHIWRGVVVVVVREQLLRWEEDPLASTQSDSLCSCPIHTTV
jgi:hypothetical protein